jgi:hypothetical protein
MLSLSYGVQIQNAQNFRFHNWWFGRGGLMLWPSDRVKTSHYWFFLGRDL